MQKAKKLKQEERTVVLAYAQLKLKANRLAKELDTMKQNVVDVFDRSNPVSYTHLTLPTNREV